MQVKLEKNYFIPASVTSAWTCLQDIKSVAACMPGAEITEQTDERHYKGIVKVKLGPAAVSFKGEIEIKNIDTQKREIQMLGKGKDIKGTSGATMDLSIRIQATENKQCELVGVSIVTVTGKMASFGGRMMTQVADQILNQFSDNFINTVIATGEGNNAEQAAAKLEEQPKELNVLSLTWKVLINFLKNIFKRPLR